MAVHFVGFRESAQFHRAVSVFGQPDFVHRRWDVRAKQEVVGDDSVVFAAGSFEAQPAHPSFDDSTCF